MAQQLALTKWHWAVFICLLVIDQATKAAAQLQGSVIINRGISFGFFNSVPSWLLTLLLVLVVGVFTWLWSTHEEEQAWAGVWLGAGAISNIIDRILFAGVRDWLPVPVLSNYNNLADWYITIGVIVYLSHSLWKKKQS